VKTLWSDFIKGIIPKSRTLRHFLTFFPDAYLATKIPDMSGKKLTYGNPIRGSLLLCDWNTRRHGESSVMHILSIRFTQTVSDSHY